MVLKEGQVLSTKEFASFMGISANTLRNNKEKYLENFGLYYNFEVYQEGRSNFYKILKVKGDYQPPKRKKAKKTIERENVYEKVIIKTIEEDPVQSYSNINRKLVKDRVVEKFEITEGTSYEYVRKDMKAMFGSEILEGGTKGQVIDKIWCKIDKKNNRYIKMTPEETKIFFEMLSENRVDKKLIEMVDEYVNNEITKDKILDLLDKDITINYQNARKEFKSIYGYYPQKVKVYMLNSNQSNEIKGGWFEDK